MPKIDLGLTAYDEMFMTDQERADAKLPRIYDIPLDQIDDFPDHPFKVRMDEDMDQLVQSIKERGLITPITLRTKDDGRYEIVSGHRRKKACELAGLPTVKAEIREISRDEAIILMVESNLQRSVILPSEKAFSYKMRLEAMKRQAGRPSKDNLVPVGQNYSREELATQTGDSQTQIQRYIRLTELQPAILDLVDEGKIGLRPAVELSYPDLTRGTPVRVSHRKHIPVYMFKCAGELYDHYDEILNAINDIGMFNNGKKKDAAIALLGRYAPQMVKITDKLKTTDKYIEELEHTRDWQHSEIRDLKDDLFEMECQLKDQNKALYELNYKQKQLEQLLAKVPQEVFDRIREQDRAARRRQEREWER